MADLSTVEITQGLKFLERGIAWDEIKLQLHLGTPELSAIEVFNVSKRTPVLTGALLSDVTGEFTTDPDSDELAHIYSGTENQLDEYGRIYVQYQEGGLLGSPTFTNDPHEMFAKVATDDIGDLESWAKRQVDRALEGLVK